MSNLSPIEIKVKEWKSVKEIAKEKEYPEGTLYRRVKLETEYKGFIWKLKN